MRANRARGTNVAGWILPGHGRSAGLEWRKVGFWPGTDLVDRYGVPDHLRLLPCLHVRLHRRDAHEALIDIESLAVYAGSLPNRPLALVREWATLHRDELRQDWTFARTGRVPGAIAPLK